MGLIAYLYIINIACMKKLIILSAATFLYTGVAFAQNGGDKDKGKDKKTTTKSAPKACPGKECSKKKAA
jgi:1,4-dihydroxy-2-naphthoate octaprenyltransferase